MKQPKSSNFERMRLEAERRRLSELEAQCEELTAGLAAQAEVSRRDEAGRHQITKLEARCEALAAEIAQRAEVESRHKAEIAALTDALKSQAATERKTAAEIEAQIGSLTDRVTSVDASFSEPERLREAIAPVLSGAIRDAALHDHEQMASSIAPYVIDTVRVEILNSEDELVEAIHPRLGVLITAAIGNAIDDLSRKVDEAFPVDRWMASIKGRLTGVPSAGFMIDGNEDFSLKEAMLIERKSGLLLARERALAVADDEKVPDEDLMAGMIAALQAFAEEAYGKDGSGDLRRFSFTTDTVYLRASPTKILAVRCAGTAPPEIEHRVDTLLEQALERLRGGQTVDGAILQLADFDPPANSNDGGVSASTILGRGLGAIAATLLAIWGHGAVQGAHQDRWFAEVEQAARADAALGPYPLSITQADANGPIRIAGLLPNDEAKATLERRLDWIASPLPIEWDLAVVATSPRP